MTTGERSSRGQHGRVFRRALTAIALAVGAAVLVTATPASASPAPTSATIGGCTYNCGGYNPTNPATLQSVTVRMDLGTVNVNVHRGYRGNVRVQAWLYSYRTGTYVDSRDQWFPDENVLGSIGGAGSSLVSFRPGRGTYAVLVRLSYANGGVVYYGYPTTYWHQAYNTITGQWTLNPYNAVYL